MPRCDVMRLIMVIKRIIFELVQDIDKNEMC